MTTWPGTLPDYVLRDGYDESAQDGNIRTPMEQGPAKVRRRFTAIVRNVNAVVSLTTAQTVILDSFYDTDLAFGSLPFTWVHPRTQATVSFRFVKRHTFKPDGSQWLAALQLEILP